MTSAFFIAALAATIPLAQAHFTFVRIAVNDEWQAPTRYIRNKTEPYTEPSTPGQSDPFQNIRWYNFPTYASDNPNSVRCGRDNMAHAASTETLKVKAGDKIEMAHQRVEPSEWQDNQWYGCPDKRGTCHPEWLQDINHPGPLLVHLSAPPAGSDVRSYDGAGEWVKIHTLGLELNNSDPAAPVNWLPYNYEKQPPHFVFNIPRQTPAGQYLMRVDIVWSDFYYEGVRHNSSQLYPSCVQIEVEGDSTTVLPKGVHIPEIFAPDAPGMTTSQQMYNLKKLDSNFTYPGGPLWDGQKLIEDKPI
ncbi:lytic polysaccharide monooxygenase [Melanomma pulvis-pyrius CBS 109.77]|uniref:AA9 family lytic polysaccharide monooxygenase n=1 Tax=Melanomma pulvis-pyrius CBS 109.77 TaxID=1314802 RepID=A0A6A6X662_9PLEO|nr:lytic polysaccharide monooxygenase [Melanomma pulvis-pyrius CBS 109.77]